MAPSRAKSLPLLMALLFGILACIFAAPALASSSEPSPSVDVDLICHTDNPKDCYPRIFQPTNEFQVIHDDQEIPNGLHVRMNVWSGLKEAKINVPDETDPSLQGLPVDQAVIVVDPEQPDAPQIPKGAPAYESVGKIKEPEGDYEAKPFFEALKMLKSGATDGKGFDVALEGMEELSHDIYYGLKVTEDPAVLKALFCLMNDQNVPSTGAATRRGQQAAAILAGALQNNAAALKEVTKEWPALMNAQCPNTDKSLKEGFYSSIVPFESASPADAKIMAAKAKAKVAAITGLVKSDTIRGEFLNNDGMRMLLELLIPEGKEWATAQRKVGQLVLDTFLDEDMGAKLGEWPRTARASDTECRAPETQTGEGCWDYHVGRIMKENKRDRGHWSRDLNDRLQALRKSGKAPPHVEL
ncbi:hypothetical protein FZEAL_2785 [Fusarium zealandicum]|uniref:Nucleotide exchange factor SIL1 n=1 Tax=Fusarium zealandicum TaxID=1053134 RepID=A0A8H4XNJ4_9HYPO|nr:hypothetical protein FZEAL_2785 [Fusarium zealandicum]